MTAQDTDARLLTGQELDRLEAFLEGDNPFGWETMPLDMLQGFLCGVASAPEAMSEKAVAIGTWSIALGIPTHLGIMPQVTGSALVTGLITETAKELLGGHFIVELDPNLAADKLLEVIDQRRSALGI